MLAIEQLEIYEVAYRHLLGLINDLVSERSRFSIQNFSEQRYVNGEYH